MLIRTLELLEGVELMRERRQKSDFANLCSGPAKRSVTHQILCIGRSRRVGISAGQD